MEGAAPVDQSAEEGPKGTSTDPTSSSSCPSDISQSPPPYSSSIVPLYSSPPRISRITISPDIPIRVEYLPDSVTVPSPIFLLQGYSSSMSTLSSYFNFTNLFYYNQPYHNQSPWSRCPTPSVFA